MSKCWQQTGKCTHWPHPFFIHHCPTRLLRSGVAPSTLTTTTTTTPQPFYGPFSGTTLGEPVPEENFWTLWCKDRLTEADTPTIRLGATPSGLSSAHLHHPPMFFTGQMPFLPPNQQCQPTVWSTDPIIKIIPMECDKWLQLLTHRNLWWALRHIHQFHLETNKTSIDVHSQQNAGSQPMLDAESVPDLCNETFCNFSVVYSGVETLTAKMKGLVQIFTGRMFCLASIRQH